MDAPVEGGEGALQGLERLLAVNPSLSRTGEGEDWGQKFFRFRGRPPAEQPDVGEALRALRDFIRPFRDLLNPMLVGLLSKEAEDRCVYSTITLFWTVVIGFVEHLHSRNRMDMARNSRAYSQTWHNRLKRVDSVRLENALLGLVLHLIRGKWFESARVCGCLAVAVDGATK